MGNVGSISLGKVFIGFQDDQLELWVMGPELGEFIAGIRSENGSPCVHDESLQWLYASRASVWKADDRSLTVKCFQPEGEKLKFY